MDDIKERYFQVRVTDKQLKDMAWHSRHGDINWSDYVRRSIQRKINQLDKQR